MTELVLEEVPFGGSRYAEVTELRRAILRKPLGLDFTPEELAIEKDDVHLAALLGGRVVGTLLLRAVDRSTARIMRMAVAPDMQRQGIGRALVERAETVLRDSGVDTIMMHARCTAVGFYERCGYRTTGAVFIEQGIPHVRMEKPVPAGVTPP